MTVICAGCGQEFQIVDQNPADLDLRIGHSQKGIALLLVSIARSDAEATRDLAEQQDQGHRLTVLKYGEDFRVLHGWEGLFTLRESFGHAGPHNAWMSRKQFSNWWSGLQQALTGKPPAKLPKGMIGPSYGPCSKFSKFVIRPLDDDLPAHSPPLVPH